MANEEAFSPSAQPLKLQNHKSASNNKAMFTWIIIAIIVLFVGGWLCFCFRRKLCAKFRSYKNKKQKGKLEVEKMTVRRFGLEELKKATNNFSQSCLVGSGAFGNVYRGTFDVEGSLAIKTPHAESYTSTEEFRNEVRLLSKVKHNNLVRLMGFCEETGPETAKILVYEYVTNGSLLDYIIGRSGICLTWRERVMIAIGAAKGIAHLHEGISPSIIHRDIKPSNILIGEGFEAKVSDFGLVRCGPIGDQSHVSSQIKGTPGYLDPAYCSSFHLTPFTDVYSFGVILLQLVTARPAVESTRSNTKSHIIDWARPSIENASIEDILDVNLLTQECNIEMMLKMGEIALRCVEKVPKERPTMSQVWQELEAALNKVDNLLTKKPLEEDSQRLTTLNMVDNFLPKQPLEEESQRLITKTNHAMNHRIRRSSTNHDYSHSIVSEDGIGLQRFHVDIDSLSFQSTSLRCLETSISIDEDVGVSR
ncbi:Serine/threonine protein kinase [Handroanthus impetiginosus]|uniref:non-specific serine/threonine protein kinase n=1 Tax=Handroanthus impetiginosus TaxID=429701 RepID=A0A2G9GKK4_9LAMI|nr:Serine/threonine protein kinase [Handroanthus impetiginosus]